jgi:hypothetical protein
MSNVVPNVVPNEVSNVVPNVVPNELQNEIPNEVQNEVPKTEFEFYIFTCLHCEGTIIVHRNELNCRIFRHGVFKANQEQMNPHCPKEECDRLVAENLIIGCGKPFRVEGEGVDAKVVVCGYD